VVDDMGLRYQVLDATGAVRLLRTDRHGRRKRRSNAALRILPQGA
jgi:hypothetical protein